MPKTKTRNRQPQRKPTQSADMLAAKAKAAAHESATQRVLRRADARLGSLRAPAADLTQLMQVTQRETESIETWLRNAMTTISATVTDVSAALPRFRAHVEAVQSQFTICADAAEALLRMVEPEIAEETAEAPSAIAAMQARIAELEARTAELVQRNARLATHREPNRAIVRLLRGYPDGLDSIPASVRPDILRAVAAEAVKEAYDHINGDRVLAREPDEAAERKIRGMLGAFATLVDGLHEGKRDAAAYIFSIVSDRCRDLGWDGRRYVAQSPPAESAEESAKAAEEPAERAEEPAEEPAAAE